MPRDSSVFVHEKALCESEEIGARTRVWAFAHVMKGARVGADCNVCDHVFVESGAIVGNRCTLKNNVLLWDRVTLEDEVFLGPNAVFTNDFTPRAGVKKTREQFLPTLVKRGASIGANATVVCGVTIGDYALVGAGAVVIRDVPAYALVVGNPARQIGWSCRCGNKLDEKLTCKCGQVFVRAASGGLEPRESA